MVAAAYSLFGLVFPAVRLPVSLDQPISFIFKESDRVACYLGLFFPVVAQHIWHRENLWAPFALQQTVPVLS